MDFFVYVRLVAISLTLLSARSATTKAPNRINVFIYNIFMRYIYTQKYRYVYTGSSSLCLFNFRSYLQADWDDCKIIKTTQSRKQGKRSSEEYTNNRLLRWTASLWYKEKGGGEEQVPRVELTWHWNSWATHHFAVMCG